MPTDGEQFRLYQVDVDNGLDEWDEGYNPIPMPCKKTRQLGCGLMRTIYQYASGTTTPSGADRERRDKIGRGGNE